MRYVRNFRLLRPDSDIIADDMPRSTSIILGAGYSHVAGLPMATNLLDDSVYVTSKGAERRFQAVRAAWTTFRDANPGTWPEQFLTAAYRNPRNHNIAWEWAVELVAATLASPRGADVPVVRNIRYSGRLTKEVQSESLAKFWDVLCHEDLKGVLTTNYDLLAERGLRHRPFKRRKRLGFYYGGLPRPQRLKGLAQPWTVHDPQRVLVLESVLPLFKLHGSLNWTRELGEFLLYQDMRPAFRNRADAMIVPPVTEKETPSWLTEVWNGASSCLKASERWIVCGYSLPPYDLAVLHLLRRSSCSVREICLVDPFGSALTPRWQEVAPQARVSSFAGLPTGLRPLSQHLRDQI